MIARILAIALSPAQFSTGPVQSPKPDVTPIDPSGIYAVGGKLGWSVKAPGAERIKLHYEVRQDNFTSVASGDVEIGDAPTEIAITPKVAATYFLALQSATGGRPSLYGAVASPTRIAPSEPRPADFDAFWSGQIARLREVPPNPVLEPGASNRPGVDFGILRMDHVDGGHVWGQIAKPSKPGKYPALLVLQWASPPYRLWPDWVTGHAASGWLVLNIEPHDVRPDQPQAYYDALPRELKAYNSIGMESRDTSYFVKMYLADFRAVDYLASHPEWDGKTLVVMGTSMGGQQTLCVAGLHPKVTHLIVNEPAGCDQNGSLHGRQSGYPNLPSKNPKVAETCRYIDAVNFASHIRATSLVGMGFVDTVAPPVGIWAAFNQIKGRKEAAPMVDSPHNNLATKEQQLPITQRATEWLDALVHGKDPQPRRIRGAR